MHREHGESSMGPMENPGVTLVRGSTCIIRQLRARRAAQARGSGGELQHRSVENESHIGQLLLSLDVIRALEPKRMLRRWSLDCAPC